MKILSDCPSGAPSFTAELNTNNQNSNIKVIGCDPLFDRNLEYLKRKGQEDISYIIEKVKSSFNLYNWDYYKTLENLREQRTLALTRFALDYNQGKKEERYIKAELPKLPFDDKSFDLVLSGHFLFTYANKFDFEFHKASLLELFRICAKEVRIYPIQQRMLQSYSNMKELISVFDEHDIKYEFLPVPFEFQKGSNKMLHNKPLIKIVTSDNGSLFYSLSASILCIISLSNLLYLMKYRIIILYFLNFLADDNCLSLVSFFNIVYCLSFSAWHNSWFLFFLFGRDDIYSGKSFLHLDIQDHTHLQHLLERQENPFYKIKSCPSYPFLYLVL